MNDELAQLYERALSVPPGERESFVARECAENREIRDELISLLAATEEAEGFFVKLGGAVLSPPVVSEAVAGAASARSELSDSGEPSLYSGGLKPGASIGHYTIVDRLGRGGMGTVYRARDTRLKRDVALKFLYPHLTSDDDAAARLLVEARAAAGLHHPNICVVHEIGATPDGLPFIAMELCEGPTLKERLAAGPMELEASLSIARQVARALGSAHSRNIIHRDVKPGNIILEADGTVKLLDFGLAKSSDVSITRPGSTPGTVAYMSPEQIRAAQVDHRSDWWSLGVLLYEMLAGRRPFRGGNDRVVIQAILNEDPEPLAGLRAGLPPGVTAIVDRLLRKDREARYSLAKDVLADLEYEASSGENDISWPVSQAFVKRNSIRLAGSGAVLVALIAILLWSGRFAGASDAGVIGPDGAEPSVAILPLTNLSADSVDAVFAVGLTEDLIATLARVGGVRVIASTSTSGFRDRKIDVRQIAESLGVANILEGSVQKNKSHIRVDLRLIAGRDGSTIWSQFYDREFKDMLSVQDEIVRTVVGELGLRFDKDRQVRRHRTRSIAAYELYLRGSDPVLFRSQAGVWKALEYFQRAIAADTTYAAAHAGLALAQVRRGRLSDPGKPIPELYALAENSARRAIALDESLPEAHFALGRVLEVQLEFVAAEEAIRRAITLDPTRSVYYRWLATLHAWNSQPVKELAEARRAIETDPLNPYSHIAMASALAANKRVGEALEQMQRIAAVKPPLQIAPFVIAQCYFKQQRLAEAIAILRPQAEGGDPMFRGLLGFMLARAGQREEARQLLADLVAVQKRTGIGAFQVGMVHAGLGDNDQAFAWFDRSVDDRSISSMVMGPTFDNLRPDPRFEKLQERLGLVPR